MLSGAAVLTLNDALIKGLAETYPTGELLFIRGVFVWPWILVFALRSGGLISLRINNFRGQALRGVCVIASAFFFINGLRHLTLADAIAVAFTGPLFITAMAPLVLGREGRLAALGGGAGGFCGGDLHAPPRQRRIAMGHRLSPWGRCLWRDARPDHAPDRGDRDDGGRSGGDDDGGGAGGAIDSIVHRMGASPSR